MQIMDSVLFSKLYCK